MDMSIFRNRSGRPKGAGTRRRLWYSYPRVSAFIGGSIFPSIVCVWFHHRAGSDQAAAFGVGPTGGFFQLAERGEDHLDVLAFPARQAGLTSGPK
jgi:hypothetical protein